MRNLHDAAMSFAANSALGSGDRVATLDISYQTRCAVEPNTELHVRADVVRLTRQIAYLESTVSDHEKAMSRARATFVVRRKNG